MKNRSILLNHDFEKWAMFLTMTGFLIPIVIHDIKNKKIPDIYVLPGYTCLLYIRFFIFYNYSPLVIIDGIAGFLVIWLVWYFSHGKIGRGDAKLSSFIAISLGLSGWLVALFFASVTGLIVAVVLLFLKKINRKQGIPFAPFLALGSIISFFTKDLFMRLYHAF